MNFWNLGPPLVSKLVSYLFMKRSAGVYPEMYDGEKIFRTHRIVMEIRYTGEFRGFRAQFKHLFPPRPPWFEFLSPISNLLFFVSFFCLVEFISLRYEQKWGGGEIVDFLVRGR